MKYLTLINSDDVAIVDDYVYERFKSYPWRLDQGYVFTYVNGTTYSLHKTAYRLHHGHDSVPDGWHIDHVNRNRLDNRISNLRCIDSVSNMYNRGKRADSQQKYKGVQRRSGTNKYRARLKYTDSSGKQEVYSSFNLTEVDAAIYYNILSAEYHGDYSVGNTVSQLHELYYPQLCL